jgi:hypothetical protein
MLHGKYEKTQIPEKYYTYGFHGNEYVELLFHHHPHFPAQRT